MKRILIVMGLAVSTLAGAQEGPSTVSTEVVPYTTGSLGAMPAITGTTGLVSTPVTTGTTEP